MPLDFTKIGAMDAAETVVHPRELFTVLRKDGSRYQYPRDVQAEVWERWHLRRSERDLVIKMNTGGGKTVVGLILLRSLLNEKKAPAAYITPDKYLTRQVLDEAAALGVDATEDVDDPRFRRGQAILVANIYKLVNGKSAFGVGSEGARIPLGSVVVDDAHACLATTEGQFTLRLDSDTEPYKALFALFREDLRAQSPTGVLDVEAEDPNKDMLVPYWAWIDKTDQVTAILHAARKSKPFEFPWPLLADIIPLCQCAFGGGAAEISPRCLPMEAIPSFANASRRVFMTATLADDSVLVTHFDVGATAARTPITPSRADDVGDRLILIPQELNPSIDDAALRDFAKDAAASYNVVVIVPSTARAALWTSHADQTLDASGLTHGVARLKAGHVGLTVIVNKYDGIDLPDGACRVLILDGVPDVRSKMDRLEQAMLHGSAAQTTAVVQRIEQGMGRGIRSNADYCVVLLSGRSLTRQIYTTDALDKFTPATRAQFDLSQKAAAQIRRQPLPELRSVIDQVLRRERGWVDAARGALVHVKYSGEGNVSDIALAQREAFNAARQQDYPAAIEALQAAVNSTPDLRVRGWLRQQLAEYTHFSDPVNSQLILRAAAKENKLVTRPLKGIDYLRIRQVEAGQAPSALSFLTKRYPSANHLTVSVNGLLDALKFEPSTASAFERSFAELGRHIGFATQRPEAEYGRGPDVLWSLGEMRFLVVECKNGAQTETINKRDVNQLTGSMNWFSENYDASCIAIPVMVHPAKLVERAGSAHAEMRVLTTEKLADLKGALAGYAHSIAAKAWPTSSQEIAELLEYHHLTASAFVGSFTTGFVRQR